MLQRVVVIFNGHSYVVLKYVVAKQIKCKNCITSEKVFVLSSQKINNFDICFGKANKQKKLLFSKKKSDKI